VPSPKLAPCGRQLRVLADRYKTIREYEYYRLTLITQ